MKVCLVVPFSKTHYVVPPLGLGYLATALRNLQVEVEILDCIKDKITTASFAGHIRRLNPDVVGFQFFSSDYDTVRQKVEMVKKVNPAIIAIAGGAHPSALPLETLRAIPALDYAFRGESEAGLPMLLKRLQGDNSVPLEQIPGLAWRDGDRPEAAPPSFTADLDTLGIPAWDLMEPKSYRHAPQGVFLKNTPVAPVSTSRGCPFPCTYCAGHTLMGRRIRKRSIEHVIREIEMLYYDYGVREIHIVDDNFTMFKDRVKQFCAALQEKKLKVSFTFPNGVRLDTLDREIVATMRDAGCYSMILGIESGSQRVLDLVKKKLSLETIREKVSMINSLGIEVRGFFILGFPGETKEEMLATIGFARELDLTAAHFSNFLPLPGSEATEMLISEGRIEDIDWNQLSYYRVPYVPEGMTAGELKAMQRKAYLDFYLRSRIILRLLAEVKSLHHLGAIARRLLDYIH